MTKAKFLVITLFIGIVLFLIPNISNATVDVSRNIYSNNGSMKFNFSGLTLNTSHEYEFGLTKTKAASIETWHLITEYTETTAVVDVMTTTKDLREVINAVDNGFITIKDKNTNTIALESISVDLKTPFLNLTNYTVIPNGKQFGSLSSDETIQIALRNAENSNAYYQYEKITDNSVINKYKELKANSGNYSELQSLLKQTVPTSNWNAWDYWNGHDSITGMDGFGYTQRNISVPDNGLYYMWVYFSGKNIKNVYGYILVDNLQPEIVLDSISLPKTKEVELGKTLTLTPTFNPENTTNKIVTWTSSDESVATVSNAGLVTAKKIGSTIITVTSQDGNKKATCTVTVTEATTNNSNEEKNTTDTPKTETSTTSTATKNDTTVSSTKLPKTGVGFGLAITSVIILGIAIFTYLKCREFKGI